MLPKGIASHRSDIIVIILIFLFAFGLRVLQQKESIPESLLRGDSTRYFNAAYNLWQYGTYSIAPPNPDGGTPSIKTNLYPGYPFFLKFFFNEGLSIRQFIQHVCVIQALMGAVIVVFIFLIARLSLNISWATVPGILTAISPHLIISEGHILTETLFTVLLVIGIWLMIMAWKSNNGAISILTGIFLSLTAYTRYINLLIIPFLALVFFLNYNDLTFSPLKKWMKSLFFLFLGCLFVFIISISFNHLYSANETHGDTQHMRFKSQRAVLSSMIKGSYPADSYQHSNLLPWQNDPAFERMMNDNRYAVNILKERFLSDPLDYIKWYIGGKVFFMWKWEGLFTSDAYIYPMLLKGFQINPFLYFCYAIMYLLHWPIFYLTFLFPIILFPQFKKLKPAKFNLLLCSFGFIVYISAVVSILQSTPRYSIPLQPFFFIISTASLSLIITALLKKLRYYYPMNQKALSLSAVTILIMILYIVFQKSSVNSYFKPEARYNFIKNVIQIKNNNDNYILPNKSFDEAFPAIPTYMSWWHCGYGNEAIETMSLNKAIRHLKAALALNPENTMAAYNLGVIFSKQNQLSEAIIYYKKAVHLSPSNEKAHLSLGNALLKKGRPGQAVSHFKSALSISPDSPSALNSMGEAFLELNEPGTAIDFFKQTLQLSPDNKKAHSNLGNALMKKNRFKEAIFHFKEILKDDPDHAGTNINMGVALTHINNIDAAIIHYQTSLKTAPDIAEVHNNLGVLLVEKTRYDLAKPHFEAALQLRPDYISAKNNLQRLKVLEKQQGM